MANPHQNNEIDPNTLNHAKQNWTRFTKATEYVVIATIVVLILMAATLV